MLDHILVLAVAQEVGRDETKPKVVNAVTLEVTPQQAEMIDLARSVGELSLVLRNQADPEDSETIGVTKNSLLDIQPEATPPVINVSIPQKPVQKAIKIKPQSKPAPLAVLQKKCTKVITGLTETLECF